MCSYNYNKIKILALDFFSSFFSPLETRQLTSTCKNWKTATIRYCLLGHVTTYSVRQATLPRLHSNVMPCTAVWGLTSTMTTSLRNSIHPPKMEHIPPKTVCGCQYGKVMKMDHTCNSHTLHNAWCLTSTETIRLIRDGERGERGMEVVSK